MYSTLKIMEEELKQLNEQFEPLNSRKIELENEIEDYKLNNGLFHPMSDLAGYKGKDIRWIKVVERIDDNTLCTDFIGGDEICEIDEDGHLYYSSFQGGITRWDNTSNKYVHYYYGCPDYHDYVGYLEVKFYKD